MIREIAPELIVCIYAADALILNVSTYLDKPHLLVVTMPTCPMCVKLKGILAEFSAKRPDVDIYTYSYDPTDFYSVDLRDRTGIQSVPALFVIGRKNRLHPLVPTYLDPDERDPSGVLRLDADLLGGFLEA